MPLNHRLNLFLRSLLISLIVTTVAGSATAETALSPLRVGVILPLSGRAASLGKAVNNGIKMAHEALPPGTRKAISLCIEDDLSERANAISALRKMEADGKLDVVLTALSNSGNAVVPLSEAKRIVHLSLAFDRRISENKQYAFSFWPDAASLARAACDELEHRGLKKAAAVTTQHEGNYAMRRALFECSAGKIEYPLSEEVLPEDSDFRTAILRLRQQDVQVVAALLHPAHLGIFVRSLREQRSSLPVGVRTTIVLEENSPSVAPANGSRSIASSRAGS